MGKKERKSKLGDGAIAFLDLPDVSGGIVRHIIRGEVNNEIRKVTHKGEKIEYGHTAFRLNGHDLMGAIEEEFIFSSPVTSPSEKSSKN